MLLAACSAPAERGTLELRFVLPDEGITRVFGILGEPGGQHRVTITPEWAGANQAELRDDDYTRIPLVVDGATFPATAGGAVTVARGPVPIGRYSHVFVAAQSVAHTFSPPTASSLDYPPRGITSHIEPIARGFTIGPGETVVIDIELVVLPAPARFGTGHEIFVKDARVVQP